MTTATTSNQSLRQLGWFLVGMIGFLLTALLLCLLFTQSGPKPLGADRAEERRQARLDIEQQAQQNLHTYGVVDAEKGFYRLPISIAKELTVQLWKNPEQARQLMIERGKEVHAAPPPPAPAAEEPSPFE